MTQFLKTQTDIINWLNTMEIKNYTLILDEQHGFKVDVGGDVDLSDKDIHAMPVKFNHVKGYFDCANCSLTSLEGCPNIVEGTFWCNENSLVNLYGAPKIVEGSFYCSTNRLTSLEGLTVQSVRGDFDCSENRLTDFKNAPLTIGSSFCCSSNQIKTIEFFPQYVGGYVELNNNPELGLIQNIRNFDELFEIHQNIVEIKTEKKILLEQTPTVIHTHKNYKI